MLHVEASHRGERESDKAMMEITKLHRAYIEAMRRHAALLRGLDKTLRLAADVMDTVTIDPDQKSIILLSLDNHIGEARSILTAIDQVLSSAVSRNNITH